MQNYEKPCMEVIELQWGDVVTASNGGLNNGGEGFGDSEDVY